jgi:replicative DNA helicase
LQLMTGGIDTKGSREQEVSHISRNLKVIAKELNVPILALSQLNRSVETRSGSKRPQLSDLRESGAIEQDADIVCFIHRPEKYGIEEDEDGNPTKGIAEIIIAKHRNGALEDVRLRFKSELAKFCDLEEGDSFNADVPIQTVTFGSKMNQANELPQMAVASNPFDLGSNTSFDSEAPF